MAEEKKDILNIIINRKRQLVEQCKLRIDLQTLHNKIQEGLAPVIIPFYDALSRSLVERGIGIIAELKQASPSKGLLCTNYNPGKLAQEYENNYAACISVLTDAEFFLGSNTDLETVKRHSSLPVLRKDFIVDEYQIYESRLLGADCILLIAAVLSEEQLHYFYELAKKLSLDVIIEVANEKELHSALTTRARLIGINNRNLRSFNVDINNTVKLRRLITDERIVICESGIKTRKDIECMLENDIHAFLIGEALMTASEPGKKLRQLLSVPL